MTGEASKEGKPRRSRNWAIALGSLVCAVVLAAVLMTTSDDGESHADDPGSPGAMALGGTVNYEPVSSPGELLAGMARDIPDRSLVVRGSIERFATGRAYLTEPGLPSHTAVMELAVEEVIAGELPAGSNDKVYMELDASAEGGERDAKALEEDVSPGTELLAYFWRMPPEGIFQGISPAVEQRNPGAGRPEGQPLHRPVPPGLYLQEPGRDAVIWAFENVEFEGRSLEDFEPGSGPFPTDGQLMIR